MAAPFDRFRLLLKKKIRILSFVYRITIFILCSCWINILWESKELLLIMNPQYVKSLDISRRASLGLLGVKLCPWVLVYVLWINGCLTFQPQRRVGIFVLHFWLQRNYNFIKRAPLVCVPSASVANSQNVLPISGEPSLSSLSTILPSDTSPQEITSSTFEDQFSNENTENAFNWKNSDFLFYHWRS